MQPTVNSKNVITHIPKKHFITMLSLGWLIYRRYIISRHMPPVSVIDQWVKPR